MHSHMSLFTPKPTSVRAPHISALEGKVDMTIILVDRLLMTEAELGQTPVRLANWPLTAQNRFA